MQGQDKGVFCISLDFEKFWGIHDISEWKNNVHQLSRVDDIITRTLQLFKKHEIHATWACVGLLIPADPIKAYAYKGSISYAEKRYSPFPLKQEKYTGIPSEIVSEKKAIEEILNSKNQELGSHTFSHLYTLEKGVGNAEIIEDLDEMTYLGNTLNHSFKSIVFPRNQVNDSFLELLAKEKYTSYRGNQPNKLWENSTYAGESKLKRGRRWADAYFGKSQTQFLALSELEVMKGLVNIPASRFLRPISENKLLEKRKINKIKGELDFAAKNGKLYHLWWHPHNFSREIDWAFEQLEEILTTYKKLETEHNFVSLNMHEIARNVQ